MIMITTANQCSQDSDADVFLDENQLGARWHVTTRMLQQARWKGAGCIYVKIGRMVRYRLSDVKAYELSRTVAREA